MTFNIRLIVQVVPPIQLGFFRRKLLEFNLAALISMTKKQFNQDEFIEGAKLAFAVRARSPGLLPKRSEHHSVEGCSFRTGKQKKSFLWHFLRCDIRTCSSCRRPKRTLARKPLCVCNRTQQDPRARLARDIVVLVLWLALLLALALLRALVLVLLALAYAPPLAEDAAYALLKSLRPFVGQ